MILSSVAFRWNQRVVYERRCYNGSYQYRGHMMTWLTRRWTYRYSVYFWTGYMSFYTTLSRADYYFYY